MFLSCLKPACIGSVSARASCEFVVVGQALLPASSTSEADLGGGCRGWAPPPPRDDLRFSNTTGILQKNTMWFIGVEVEQETSAPRPKKNPGSAPGPTRAETLACSF